MWHMGSSVPGMEPMSLTLVGRFYTKPPGKPSFSHSLTQRDSQEAQTVQKLARSHGALSSKIIYGRDPLQAGSEGTGTSHHIPPLQQLFSLGFGMLKGGGK